MINLTHKITDGIPCDAYMDKSLISELINLLSLLSFPDKLSAKLPENFILSDELIKDGCVSLNTVCDFALSNGSLVRPFCVIERGVFIGGNSTIGPMAFIRSGSVIGDNCVIGAAEINCSIIGNKSILKHKSYIGYSVVGSQCLIGDDFTTSTRRLDFNQISVVNAKTGDSLVDSVGHYVGSLIENDTKIGCRVLAMPGTYFPTGAYLPNRSYGGKQNTEGVVRP